MQTYDLVAHPAHLPDRITAVRASIVGRDRYWLRLRWRIERGEGLIVPAFAGQGRADGLWKTTCFELFCRQADGPTYCEFNLSPSERWAAYDFEGYRSGMRARPVERDPVCTYRAGGAFSIFDAAIPAAALPADPSAINLACVLDEADGVKSFWALAHPEDRPDFHDPACFTGQLAARRPV